MNTKKKKAKQKRTKKIRPLVGEEMEKRNQLPFLEKKPEKKIKLEIKEYPETENWKETSIPDKSEFLTPLKQETEALQVLSLCLCVKRGKRKTENGPESLTLLVGR